MKFIPVLFTLLVLVCLLSGCVESFFNFPTTYESHPTKITYTIFYGYAVNCSGSGRYEINYDCDIPDVLLGNYDYSILYRNDFKILDMVNNSFIRWNVSGDDETFFELGLSVDVVAQSFLIQDLNGEGSLSIEELKSNYPVIVDKYLQAQSNNDIVLIDPFDPNIIDVAQNIADLAGTDDSFLLAKEIFSWFSKNTVYKIHDGIGSVQPAAAAPVHPGA